MPASLLKLATEPPRTTEKVLTESSAKAASVPALADFQREELRAAAERG
jgi:hypothetical protein